MPRLVGRTLLDSCAATLIHAEEARSGMYASWSGFMETSLVGPLRLTRPACSPVTSWEAEVESLPLSRDAVRTAVMSFHGDSTNFNNIVCSVHLRTYEQFIADN